MTTMNVSLSRQMREWVRARIDSGQYHNTSEYVRDLIRKDQAELNEIEAFRSAIDEGRSSGVDGRSFSQIIEGAMTVSGRSEPS